MKTELLTDMKKITASTVLQWKKCFHQQRRQDLHALPHMMHFHMMHQKMTAKDYILYLSVKMENKDV
jgi:hypothetical protein